MQSVKGAIDIPQPDGAFCGNGPYSGRRGGYQQLRVGGIVMITFVRTATIAPGKVGEALAFAHQIAKLVDKITGLKVGVSMPVSGNPFRIAWVAAEPDLAAVEANTNKLLSNPEYMKMSEGGASLFLPGSAHDEMWRSV
jgi:hypothetical protein